MTADRFLTKFRRIEGIAYRLRQMPTKEAYYWYSKCTAEWARQAVRVLLAAE